MATDTQALQAMMRGGRQRAAAPTTAPPSLAEPPVTMDRQMPGQRAEPPAPTAAPPAMTPYDDAKRQMDEVFGRYNRTPREDEYAQWLGPGGYISKNDVDGTSRTIGAYAGGAVDPYWLMRMGMHAQGDYFGNGATPGDVGAAQMAAQRLWRAGGMQAQSGVKPVTQAEATPTEDGVDEALADPRSFAPVTPPSDRDALQALMGGAARRRG